MDMHELAGHYGRRRAMSAEEYRKLEQYVVRMVRAGYSAKIISQSVPLSPTGVRSMVKRLQAQGAEAA